MTHEKSERRTGLTATTRSVVVESRRSAKDFIDFPNPLRKEMEAAWRLPDGYDEENVKTALMPLAAFLPKAMQLCEKGETIKALGVCFDLFDMLVVLKSSELRFFIDDEGATMCSWTLAEVALYPICKIYNDSQTPQDVKTEIYARIEAYGKQYNFPEKSYCGRTYEPNETFREFGSFERELDFYDFFDMNPYNIHETEEAEALSDEEYGSWQQKIYREVFNIRDYGRLSTEALAHLSEILAGMYFFHSDIEMVCSLDHYNSCLDGVKSELLSRLGKSADLAEQSTIFSSLCEMARVSVYKFTDDVIAKEKEFISRVQSTKDIDYHILHIALLLLRRIPLANSKPDGYGNISYTFTLRQDFYAQTLRSWATSQNKDGSWTGISADEAFGRIVVIASDCGAIKDIDSDRLTYLAYSHYSPTPCTTPKELYAKFMACDTKYRRPEENSPAVIHRQAIAMLDSESLSLADRLLLYNIIL